MATFLMILTLCGNPYLYVGHYNGNLFVVGREELIKEVVIERLLHVAERSGDNILTIPVDKKIGVVCL
jgi:hypothetical protein